MNLTTKVYESLQWKRSNEYCAEKLGMSKVDYLQIKSEILRVKVLNQINLDNVILNSLNETEIVLEPPRNHPGTTLEPTGQKTEEKYDLDHETGTITGISTIEPKSAEDIIKLLNIDTTKWKLSSYWNKQKRDCWLISAFVTAVKSKEMTLDQMEDIIAEVFSTLPLAPIKSCNYPTTSNNKALFVYFSDRHIGASVDGTRSIYHNDYDESNYETRVKLVLHEIVNITKTFGTFEDLYIIDLGDKVDGQDGLTTRGGHKLPQNMTNRDVFRTALKVEKDFYDMVIDSDIARHYHVYQNANSNHGGDMEFMVNHAIELYLNTVYPHVKTKILEKFIEHFEYGKHLMMLTHGKDDADKKFGLPLNINDKTENYLNKYLMHNKIDPREYSVSLIKGDLHVNNSQDAYGFRYKNVLSLFGGSKWIGNNYGPCDAGCSFDIIEKETKRIYEHRIFFDR